MKNNLIILFLIVIGCNSPDNGKIVSTKVPIDVDSIIKVSNQSIISLDSTGKKTDSTISGKVEKTVKQITQLKEENKQLKQENNVLKNKLNDINNSGKPFELLPVSNH